MVQGEQALADLLVGEVDGPAIGSGHGFVELLVREIEPGRPLVVEVGQRALLQFHRAFGVPRHETRAYSPRKRLRFLDLRNEALS
jgi:hypothetical protein